MSAYLCSQAKEWLTLLFLPGLGCSLINKLIAHNPTPREILHAGKTLRSIPGIGAHTVQCLSDVKQRALAEEKAERELERLHLSGLSLYSRLCEAYPHQLRSIPDPPPLFYCHGTLPGREQPVIGIVGSRSASNYGKRISSMLAFELAQQGVCVVSGGAYGIDTAAHKGALDGGGNTVSVLGCGVDVVYPKSNQQLFDDIALNGALLSEYSLGTRPDGFRFPERNRIISGLVSGIIVVEATLKSGSLITARLALDQGRDVFAVPGRIDSPKSSGCHKLIQQGAYLVQSVEDVFEALSLVEPKVLPRFEEVLDSPMDKQEKTVLSCLDVYPVDIDTISRVTGIMAHELHSVLLNLELKGCIRQVAGQQYEKIIT